MACLINKPVRRPIRGQTAIEYLVLCGIVAFMVFMAFSKGGFIFKVHDNAKDQYETVTRVIMGENPNPIPGGWCEWTPCSPGVNTQYRTCECPAPAFGGQACSGESSKLCK